MQASGERHIGELTMDFEVVFYQGPEDFSPIVATPIQEIMLYADLIDVADLLGTYAPPFDYPVAPAPRPSGPDGRVEVAAVINIPNES